MVAGRALDDEVGEQGRALGPLGAMTGEGHSTALTARGAALDALRAHGLRLREGIPEAWLDAHAAPALERFIGRGLLERADDRVRITKPGRLLADGIITDLLVAEET